LLKRLFCDLAEIAINSANNSSSCAAPPFLPAKSVDESPFLNPLLLFDDDGLLALTSE